MIWICPVELDMFTGKSCIYSLEYETCFSLKALLKCCCTSVSQAIGAIFSHLYWEVWRNLWPQVMHIFLCSVGPVAPLSPMSWGRPSQWVLWTKFHLALYPELWSYPISSYQPSHSCPSDRTGSLQYLRQVYNLWVLYCFDTTYKIKLLPCGE